METDVIFGCDFCDALVGGICPRQRIVEFTYGNTVPNTKGPFKSLPNLVPIAGEHEFITPTEGNKFMFFRNMMSGKLDFKKLQNENSFESSFTSIFISALLILSKFWNFIYWHKLYCFSHPPVDFQINWTTLNNLNIRFSKFFCFRKPINFGIITCLKCLSCQKFIAVLQQNNFQNQIFKLTFLNLIKTLPHGAKSYQVIVDIKISRIERVLARWLQIYV